MKSKTDIQYIMNLFIFYIYFRYHISLTAKNFMLLSKQDGFGDKSKERTMRKLLFLGVALGAMAISSNGFTSTVSRPSAPHISGGSVARPSMAIPPRIIAPPPSSNNIVRPVSPQLAIPNVVRPPVTANSVARPTIVPGVAPPRPPSAPPSAIDTRMTQGHSQETLNAFRADQAKFAKPPVAVPQTRQAALQSPGYRQYGTRYYALFLNNDGIHALQDCISKRLAPSDHLNMRKHFYLKQINRSYGEMT